MISLFHSPHPASRATWKGLQEPAQRPKMGSHLGFRVLKLRRLRGQKNGPYWCWSACAYLLAHACVSVFPSPLQTCLLATMLGEWWPSTRTDHLSCQAQVTEHFILAPWFWLNGNSRTTVGVSTLQSEDGLSEHTVGTSRVGLTMTDKCFCIIRNMNKPDKDHKYKHTEHNEASHIFLDLSFLKNGLMSNRSEVKCF